MATAGPISSPGPRREWLQDLQGLGRGLQKVSVGQLSEGRFIREMERREGIMKSLGSRNSPLAERKAEGPPESSSCLGQNV